MNTAADMHTGRSARDVLSDISFEVMPFKGTEEAVVEHVPADVELTVTVTEAKGLDVTVDLATRLAARGYRVAPHLAARLVRDDAHARDLLDRLTDAGIDRLFVIGGDAATPAGTFTAAIDLLRVVGADGRFRQIGIGGYPEGHPHLAAALERRAGLAQKAPLASHAITQMCFDAGTTVEWARRVHRSHPGLGVRVGVPGPVSMQKLMRVSAGIGLGQSARFLRKQQTAIRKLLQPGGYRPDRLLRELRPHLTAPDVEIRGIHLFTFNELERSAAWRQSMLDRLEDD